MRAPARHETMPTTCARSSMRLQSVELWLNARAKTHVIRPHARVRRPKTRDETHELVRWNIPQSLRRAHPRRSTSRAPRARKMRGDDVLAFGKSTARAATTSGGGATRARARDRGRTLSWIRVHAMRNIACSRGLTRGVV
jgi:hypothetical protein